MSAEARRWNARGWSGGSGPRRGAWLRERVGGIDGTEAASAPAAISIGSERTFPADFDDDDERRPLGLCSSAAGRPRAKERRARTVTVRLRDHDHIGGRRGARCRRESRATARSFRRGHFTGARPAPSSQIPAQRRGPVDKAAQAPRAARRPAGKARRMVNGGAVRPRSDAERSPRGKNMYTVHDIL